MPEQEREERQRERVHHGAILAGALLVLLAAALLRPLPSREGLTFLGVPLPPTCASMRLGLPCPGCGLTRSFALGVRLDPEAFRLHRLGPLLLALVVAQVPWRAWRLLRPAGPHAPERRARRERWTRGALVGLGVALVVNWGLTLVERFG